MQWVNHFLFSLTLLIIFLWGIAPLKEMIFFTVIFALFVDFDILLKLLLKDHSKERRTWVQEPLGFIFLAVPLGLILSYIYASHYFFLVTIPYASHILLDYSTTHHVFPFAPFSKKKIKTGFIKPMLNLILLKGGFNENHFFLVNLIFFVFLMFLRV